MRIKRGTNRFDYLYLIISTVIHIVLFSTVGIILVAHAGKMSIYNFVPMILFEIVLLFSGITSFNVEDLLLDSRKKVNGCVEKEHVSRRERNVGINVLIRLTIGLAVLALFCAGFIVCKYTGFFQKTITLNEVYSSASNVSNCVIEIQNCSVKKSLGIKEPQDEKKKGASKSILPHYYALEFRPDLNCEDTVVFLVLAQPISAKKLDEELGNNFSSVPNSIDVYGYLQSLTENEKEIIDEFFSEYAESAPNKSRLPYLLNDVYLDGSPWFCVFRPVVIFWGCILLAILLWALTARLFMLKRI